MNSCATWRSLRNRWIMFYGLTASGKSTMVQAIDSMLWERGLMTSILKSSFSRVDRARQLGCACKVFDDTDPQSRQLRDRDYRRIINLAPGRAHTCDVVALDASFNRRARRQWVYDAAQARSIDLLIVWCVCDDLGEVRRRIESRRSGHGRPDDEASLWKIYRLIASQADPIEKDELLSGRWPIVRLDTFRRTVEQFHIDRSSQEIADIVATAARAYWS